MHCGQSSSMVRKFGIKQEAALHQAGTVTNTEKLHTHLGACDKTGEYY